MDGRKLYAFDTLMNGTLVDRTEIPVTLDQFRLFYSIDRDLYIILVRDLCRNPSESLIVMGLWLWLEREGISSVISKIVPLNRYAIDALADEAVTCIDLLTDGPRAPPEEGPAVALIHSLVKIAISLNYLRENRVTVYNEIQGLVSQVYILALADLMEQALHGGFHQVSAARDAAGPSRTQPEEPLVLDFARLSIERGSDERRRVSDEGTGSGRTMFATFSRGYPVTEAEVINFFTRRFGDCIEMLLMQDVGPTEQALFARIVFFEEELIRTILNGETKAKFTINGKHVWMRQFVPRN
ncbi:hypothetical protein ACP275_12G131000 [Erythranthe tilingii]